MGINAIIHYSTMLDVTARALQRSFAIAFISGQDISFEIAEKFKECVSVVINPLLSCNMAMFTHLSGQMVNLAQAIESHDFHQYYALTANEPTPELSKCVQELASQIKRVSPRLKSAFSVLSCHGNASCSCGNSSDDLKNFFPLVGKASATDLMPLFYLCPCGSSNFHERFQQMFEKLTMESTSSGVVFACNTAIVNPTATSTISSYPIQPKFAYDNTLTSFSKVLCNIIFCILCGDPVIVAASKDRFPTLEDVLDKLLLLRPSKRKEQRVIFESFEEFKKSSTKQQFCAIIMSRNESLTWICDKTEESLVQVDLNNQKVKCQNYKGNLLKNLTRLHFPTDGVLLSYIAYVFTNINRLTVLANNSSFDSVVKEFKISDDDQIILQTFLTEMNFEKYGHLLKPNNKTNRKCHLINL
uniref:UDENN FLCN/SMCR8-type domain-containing protein n=1 Tax=Panagrolaimus sp. JU765 TaxID=591449 RepID=A0AC34PUI2_9BILA